VAGGRARRGSPEYRDPVSNGSRLYGRLAFLGLLAGGASSLAWATRVSGYVSPFTSAISETFADLLPVGGWRIYTISGSMPIFYENSYTLEIGGLVRKPRSFTYEELRALPQAHQVSTFHCVTGWIVDDVRWGGVRFRDLLAHANPLPSAHAAHFISAEIPYDDYLTLGDLALPDVMLAYEMNGQPLPQEHGSPVRVVIPDMYGYKNVKWVNQITLVPKQALGYWEQRGYDVDAWVGRSNGYG
jgi:DMSO/TMAO reductase YedYZ molybdopterin-dependent catalytic subunit